jgi:hypothetical protein
MRPLLVLAVLLALGSSASAGTVSQPTFSGTQFDNRSAFVKLVFCVKD